MPTISVAQALCSIVVLGKEERSVSVVGSILVKKLVDRSQESLRLIQCNSALAAKIRLEIRHQEGRRDAFPGNVADYKPDSISAEIKKIVVITADLASLD